MGSSAAPAPAPRPLVVVADDEPSIRRLVEALLADEGLLCAAVADGAQLVRLLAATRPAAIVLDIRMPVLDGFGVMELLRADPALRDIPVVAMSADVDPARVLAAGCRAFVPKPFDLGDLVVAVHTALGSALPVGQSDRR